MSYRVEVPIIRVRDNQSVNALLVTLAQKHLDDFETFWKSLLRTSTKNVRVWDWEQKKRIFLGGGDYEGYAIEYEQITPLIELFIK